MAFNSIAGTPGAGINFAFDTFVDSDGQTRTMAYGALAFGPQDGPYVVVTTSAGLPVAQQGTWTVTGAGGTFPVTDSGGSLTVDAPVGTPVFVRLSDGSAAITTLPVSAASLPLPSGASTAAKQPALGTAGTASADVITVQGVASMTPMLVTLSGTNNVATVTTVTTVGAVTAITNALPAGTNNIGDVDVLTVPSDPFGVNADAASATGSISAKLRFIAATGIPITGTVTVGSHAVTNAGTFVVQVDGAALTALQLLDDTVFADDAAFTPGTSKVSAIGFIADETATDSVDEGDVGAARMTLDRKQHVAAELESNSMRGAGTALVPKFVIIDCATSGDNTILAAVASKKIRVLSMMLVSAGTTTVRMESGTGGTALTGQMNLTAQTGFALAFSPVGHFETASNTLLNLELSAAVSVDGCLTYVEVA